MKSLKKKLLYCLTSAFFCCLRYLQHNKFNFSVRYEENRNCFLVKYTLVEIAMKNGRKKKPGQTAEKKNGN